MNSTSIPSISFADDLALMAPTAEDMVSLIKGYLAWCNLLGVNVTKVQLWCNQRNAGPLQIDDRTLEPKLYVQICRHLVRRLRCSND